MNIYVVEFWSNHAYRHTEPVMEESHEVTVSHYASSLARAKAWCKDNLDEGGHPGLTGYFPWHFRIFRHTLDVDENAIVPHSEGFWKFMCAINPDGRQRKVGGYR